MLGRLAPKVTSAAGWRSVAGTGSINVALTFQGLKALGVPQASLDSFSPEFQEGMAARAALLGDVGESAPANWEKPFGTPDVHVLLGAVCGGEGDLEPRVDFIRSSVDTTQPTRGGDPHRVTSEERSRSCRADPPAVSVQFCWPSALRNMAVCVQDPVAADSPGCW